jgi:hypothetical protein
MHRSFQQWRRSLGRALQKSKFAITRQFGKSKYGLSRVYKVLLDLLVIKTVASFTSRPL